MTTFLPHSIGQSTLHGQLRFKGRGKDFTSEWKEWQGHIAGGSHARIEGIRSHILLTTMATNTLGLFVTKAK